MNTGLKNFATLAKNVLLPALFIVTYLNSGKAFQTIMFIILTIVVLLATIVIQMYAKVVNKQEEAMGFIASSYDNMLDLNREMGAALDIVTSNGDPEDLAEYLNNAKIITDRVVDDNKKMKEWFTKC